MTDVPGMIGMRLPAMTALFRSAVCLFGQSRPDNGDIVDSLLLYSEYPRLAELGAAQKVEAVNKLEALRLSTTGKRRQNVSFLLAALGSHYVTNRDHLVGILNGCGARQTECDADTADLLIGLYHRSHREVLYPILRAGLHSNGALSELLGSFYGELLVNAPADFMSSLRRLGAPGQEAACGLVGRQRRTFRQSDNFGRRPQDGVTGARTRAGQGPPGGNAGA